MDNDDYLNGLQGCFTIFTSFSLIYKELIINIIANNEEEKSTFSTQYFEALVKDQIMLFNYELLIQGNIFYNSIVEDYKRRKAKQELIRELMETICEYLYETLVLYILRVDYEFFTPECFSTMNNSDLDSLAFNSEIHYCIVINLLVLLMVDETMLYQKYVKSSVVIIVIIHLIELINLVIKQQVEQYNEMHNGIQQMLFFQLALQCKFGHFILENLEKLPAILYDVLTSCIFGYIILFVLLHNGKFVLIDANRTDQLTKKLWQYCLSFLFCLFIGILKESIVHRKLFQISFFKYVGEVYEYIYTLLPLIIQLINSQLKNIEFGPYITEIILLILSGVLFICLVISGIYYFFIKKICHIFISEYFED